MWSPAAAPIVGDSLPPVPNLLPGGLELPEINTALRAETTIRETIARLLAQRGVTGIEILPESSLTADLGLDSLELAELSAVLEDDFGHDPFSDGIVPATVAELFSYYDR